MSLDAGNILGINITKSSKKQILEFLNKSLFIDTARGQKSPKNGPKIITIVTPNPEQIVYATHDDYFKKIINRADVSLPDGVGVVWAARMLGQKTPETAIPGIEFMENLVEIASKQSVPIALIGSWGGLALKALDCLSEKHVGLQGWAMNGPKVEVAGSELIVHGDANYFQVLAQKIIDTKVQMVFVGLGAPKQEYFIERLKQSLVVDYPIILMSVGGSFDEISGKVLRPPTWVSRVGLKWLWRLILEPWRIKRQLALIQFVWRILCRAVGRSS